MVGCQHWELGLANIESINVVEDTSPEVPGAGVCEYIIPLEEPGQEPQGIQPVVLHHSCQHHVGDVLIGDPGWEGEGVVVASQP